MVQTFTPSTEHTTTPSAKKPDVALLEQAEPSASVIQNILNFSKNLEVRSSNLLSSIEFIRS